jgi:DNA-binding response OmpR family regulator
MGVVLRPESMASSAPEGNSTAGGRLGGARADFVASLGRKVVDARDLLTALEDDPTSKAARDELRRRLHALGAGARLLHFDAMARALQDALVMLERAAQAGSLRETEVAFVAQTLGDLPALAWGEAGARETASDGPEDVEGEPPGRLPVSVLVVGGEALADPLTDDSGIRTRSFECERTEDVDSALQLARAYAPDLVVVDADLPRASELVAALLDDPLTEPVPIVVVGSYRSQDDAARFVALGVAKTLAKPVPPEAFRGVCDEVLDARDGHTVRLTLGEPTLEQLAERLAEELKRALVESVDRTSRSQRVPLGEGTEVLGALWGAIARVQEIVTQRTGGSIRFGGDAPEGAIALAPWLHQELPGADRMAGRGRGAAADVRLSGRRVVVADDDPGVTWFISDLLRTAGCEVHEALDGRVALDLVFRVQPELVVSDILMPGLDGFALSRALRRDVALRDTPVILLSWKEDLLQRVRELGASAAAYMRKESDSRAILARVREVLRPRARIEMRLRGEGEVRGRLDELSPRLLLDLVCVIRRDARVAVRDATFLYEIDIRGGAPRKATRTASDGSYRSGERALASLLGVGAGRFVVTPTSEPLRGDLVGSLAEQLARPIAAARGALAATTGAAAMYVERIAVERDTLDDYLTATPEPARTLVGRLAEGDSPRQLLLGGDVAPTLLEDVLADLAARGAICGVEGADGTDLLTPAVESALAVLRGARQPSVLPPNARPSAPSPVGTIGPARPGAHADPFDSGPSLSPPSPEVGAQKDPLRSEASDPELSVASSLEDAVMRELSERSPSPGPTRSQPNPPPIVEPSQLRPRSSNPPAGDEDEAAPLPSIPPDAVVPEAVTVEGHLTPSIPVEVNVTQPLPMPVDAHMAPAPAARARQPSTPDVFVSPFDVPAATPADREAPKADPATRAIPQGPSLSVVPTTSSLARAVVPAPAIKAAVATPTLGRRGPGSGMVLALLVMAGAVGAVFYVTESDHDAPSRAGTATATAIPIPTLNPNPNPAPNPNPTPNPAATLAATYEDLPPGAVVPAGYGYIQVEAPAGARVRIDGAFVGTGPLAGTQSSPGSHEVEINEDGRESRHAIEVRAGRATRVRPASPL